MISEISGVSLPKLALPGWMVVVNATLLTGLANLIKKPPILKMAKDKIQTMKEGFVIDGGKAERELGITYTPVRLALEEAIASYQRGTA
jgi:dihydroflavonol-4-reductase